MPTLQVEHDTLPAIIGDEVGRDDDLPVHVADFEIHYAPGNALPLFVKENEDGKPPRSIPTMRGSPTFLAGGGVHQAAFHSESFFAFFF